MLYIEDLKSSSTQLLPASQDENSDIGVTDSEATQSGNTVQPRFERSGVG